MFLQLCEAHYYINKLHKKMSLLFLIYYYIKSHGIISQASSRKQLLQWHYCVFVMNKYFRFEYDKYLQSVPKLGH